MQHQSFSVPSSVRPCAASGPVYLRESNVWICGHLRAEKTGLRFSSPPAEYSLKIPYRDVRRVRVLSSVAAALEPGCFDVTVNPATYKKLTGDARADTGKSHTLRFQTGALGTAAHWVGVIDDAAACGGDWSELERWWKAALKSPMQLPFTLRGCEEHDSSVLPDAKPFEEDIVDAVLRAHESGSSEDVFGDSMRRFGASSTVMPTAASSRRGSLLQSPTSFGRPPRGHVHVPGAANAPGIDA